MEQLCSWMSSETEPLAGFCHGKSIAAAGVWHTQPGWYIAFVIMLNASVLQEAERLKHENEELRKLGEDAVLDQQLSKALQETDKLKLAADAYKKELLQQKVSELQAELTQTSKRLKKAEEENTGFLPVPAGFCLVPNAKSVYVESSCATLLCSLSFVTCWLCA